MSHLLAVLIVLDEGQNRGGGHLGNTNYIPKDSPDLSMTKDVFVLFDFVFMDKSVGEIVEFEVIK